VTTLRVTPSAADWRIARAVHALFAGKPGSEHIATEFALAHLAALVRTNPVKSVLEFGSGIGTITHLLLELLPDAHIVCAERNAWCRQQFEANIPPGSRSRVTLMPLARPPVEDRFDLVVVDGPVSRGAAYLADGSVVFGEGRRSNTRSKLCADLAANQMRCNFAVYHEPDREWKLGWPMTPFGFRLPILLYRRTKGCWIGRVEQAAHQPA
jgi:hypothetical protein